MIRTAQILSTCHSSFEKSTNQKAVIGDQLCCLDMIINIVHSCSCYHDLAPSCVPKRRARNSPSHSHSTPTTQSTGKKRLSYFIQSLYYQAVPPPCSLTSVLLTVTIFRLSNCLSSGEMIFSFSAPPMPFATASPTLPGFFPACC